MASTEYTGKQLKIINGELPIETVSGRALRWFYQKALDNNDSELAQRIQVQRDVLKDEAYERNKQRARDRDAKIRHNEEIQWKQPKSNEYTVYEKQVVRGEIPYEDVKTNVLVSIHLKSHNNGDYELSERIVDLIYTRREGAKINHRLSKNLSKRTKKFTALNSDNSDISVTKWEQAVLLGIIDYDECSEKQLQHLLSVAQKRGDAVMIAIAKNCLLYKKDPEAIYIVREHREAVDLIEQLLEVPIRRPETWFTENE